MCLLANASHRLLSDMPAYRLHLSVAISTCYGTGGWTGGGGTYTAQWTVHAADPAAIDHPLCGVTAERGREVSDRGLKGIFSPIGSPLSPLSAQYFSPPPVTVLDPSSALELELELKARYRLNILAHHLSRYWIPRVHSN